MNKSAETNQATGDQTQAVVKNRYRVFGLVTASKFLGEFEAATEDEAIELALVSDAAVVSACHHCSKDFNDPEIQEASAEKVN